MNIPDTPTNEIPAEKPVTGTPASAAATTPTDAPITPMQGAVMAFWLIVATNNPFSDIVKDASGVPQFVLLPEAANLTQQDMLNKFSALLPPGTPNPEQEIQSRFNKFTDDMKTKNAVASVTISDAEGNPHWIKASITYATAVGIVKSLFKNSIPAGGPDDYPSGQICDSFAQIIEIIPG